MSGHSMSSEQDQVEIQEYYQLHSFTDFITRKAEPDSDVCMPVEKEQECQGKKHKTHGQGKKAAYTLSKPETTRKEVRETVSPSETYPIGTEGKRSGLYPLGCFELDV